MTEDEKIELAYRAGDRHGIGFIVTVFALILLAEWYVSGPGREVGSILGQPPFGFFLLFIFGIMFLVWGRNLKRMVKQKEEPARQEQEEDDG